MYIDTHAHLLRSFYDNPDAVAKTSQDNLAAVINIGTNLEESEDVLAFCAKYPGFLFPAIGFHPEYATLSEDEIKHQLKSIEMLARQHPIIAIGECGLDYSFFHDRSDKEISEIKEKQKYALLYQIDLAKSLKLPLIIHCRDAYEDFYSILTTHYPNQQFLGVLHSVDGDITIIKQLISMGFFVSFNGILTFKNAQRINALCDAISIDRIILETDAPFLSPVPVRGTQNVPTNVIYTYEYVSKRKNIALNELQQQIQDNVKRIFHI